MKHQLARLQPRIATLQSGHDRAAWQKGALTPDRVTGRAGVARRNRIKIRDSYTCAECGRVTTDIEVDHKVPISEGGSEDDSNLQLLCREPCHARKTLREAQERLGQ